MNIFKYLCLIIFIGCSGKSFYEQIISLNGTWSFAIYLQGRGELVRWNNPRTENAIQKMNIHLHYGCFAFNYNCHTWVGVVPYSL